MLRIKCGNNKTEVKIKVLKLNLLLLHYCDVELGTKNVCNKQKKKNEFSTNLQS